MAVFSVADAAPPKGNDDLGPQLQGYFIFLTILSVISILLRLWARSLLRPQLVVRRRFWWDDWIAIISFPFVVGQLILAFVAVHLGLGRHVWNVPADNLTLIFKLIYYAYIVYGFALSATKASALLFYRRIFASEASPSWFNYTLWITHVLNIMWLVAYTGVVIFQCTPVARFWDPSLVGTCVQQSGIYIGSAVPSVVIDLIILLIPLPLLWKLQMSRVRKIGIGVVFVLGYSVVVISVGRLVANLQAQGLEEDLTHDGVSSFWWGISEAPVTLFGICVPAMVTLGRHVQAEYFSPLASRVSSFVSSRLTSRGRSMNLSRMSSTDNGSNYTYEGEGLALADSNYGGSQHRILNLSPAQVRYTGKVSTGHNGAGFSSHEPHEAIQVRNDVMVTRQYKGGKR
ncbi:hypothetical protein GGS20DRAFT_263282 [Poronia punctata]|nr:hypothetical protein GGS20DRAFT_263282 [Poronia punctata]